MITVLTPTYNRYHTLPRLCESLKSQTSKDFEWILVDDGSTDETKDWFKNIINNVDFPVRYIFQKNSGKHVAINTGAIHASRDWIMIVDSDDALVKDAIEVVINDIHACDNKDLSGLCYRKAYFNHDLVGKIIVEDKPLFMHPSEAGRFFGGDLAYVFRTKSLRAHPFPVIDGEKFVPELYVWNSIGDEGEIIFFPNKAIYLCEYLSDGYTANFKYNLRKNPRGFGLFYRSQIFREDSLIRKSKCAIRAIQCLFYAIFRRASQ